MRKKSYKCIIKCAILFILLLSFNTFAEKNTVSDEIREPVFSCKEVIGNSAQSTKELFSSNVSQSAGINTPVISDVNLFYENDSLSLTAEFSYNGERISISTSGEIYKNEKTENAGICENLVLVDMEDIDNWHFVQFRIDRDKRYIIIILQNKYDYELVQFLLEISEEDFHMFYNLHENTISGEELERKILELYSVGRNLLNREIPNYSYHEAELSATAEIN